MSGKERRGGGVFGRRDRSYQTPRQRVAQALGFTGMTAVEVLGSVDELTNGTGSSVDAVTEAKSGSHRESRFRQPRRDLMKKLLILAAVVAMAGSASGQDAMKVTVMVNPGALAWKDNPAIPK